MLELEINQLSRRAFLTAAERWSSRSRHLRNGQKPFSSTRLPPQRVAPGKLSSYISIEPDGTVVAYYGKIDGGQGLETSVAQLVAEEIDVPWERVRVVISDTAQCVNMGGSTAGNGLRQGGIILRQTAAEARRLLIQMGGEKLGITPADLTVTDGVVHSVSDPSASDVSAYAELIGGRRS